jgi:hypothetical protein
VNAPRRSRADHRTTQPLRLICDKCDALLGKVTRVDGRLYWTPKTPKERIVEHEVAARRRARGEEDPDLYDNFPTERFIQNEYGRPEHFNAWCPCSPIMKMVSAHDVLDAVRLRRRELRIR